MHGQELSALSSPLAILDHLAVGRDLLTLATDLGT